MGSGMNGTYLRLTRRHCEDAYMDVGVRVKHDFREGGGTSSRMSEGRTMQDARAEDARAEQISAIAI